MNLAYSVLVLSCLVVGVVVAVKIPDGIEFCHQSNSNFDACLSIQISKALRILKDGAPELGVPKIEPFEITKMELIGESTSSVTLSQKYTHMLTYGIYISEVYDGKFKVSQDECYWDFMVLTPNIRMEADYEMNGQLLVFPINGQGKCNITFTNVRNHHQAWCELYEKRGKTYIKFVKYEIDISGEQIKYKFEDLIPGSAQLTDEVHKAINENSQEIFREVKPAFEKVWRQLHLQTANNVFGKIPFDELFPK